MGRDPVLAAHFFRIANSPPYGHPQEIASLEEALNLLGGKQLRRLWVLAATGRHSGSSLEDWGLDHYSWSRHCLASAVIARYLAASQPPGFREEAFTAALLHGLGLAGLAYLTTKGSGPEPPAYPGYGPMGGMLLSAWNLPPRLARAVAAHEAPGPPGDGGDLAVFIHAACGISNLLGCAVPGEPAAGPLSPEVMAQVGLPLDLAGTLPGILAELRSWGVLDHGETEPGPPRGMGRLNGVVQNFTRIGKNPMSYVSGEALEVRSAFSLCGHQSALHHRVQITPGHFPLVLHFWLKNGFSPGA